MIVVSAILEGLRKLKTLMSDLPLSRTSAHKKPFADCGIDYFGPLMFKEGRSLKKGLGSVVYVYGEVVPFT